MSNYTELLKGVNILIQNEASPKKIRGYLQFEEASAEDTKRILEETGLSNGRDPSKLTYTSLLKWLSDEPRTETDLYDLVLAKGTKNEARWVKDRNRLRVTLNAVYNKYNETFKEVPATEKQKDNIKAKLSA
jgi:hypothetical protein